MSKGGTVACQIVHAVFARVGSRQSLLPRLDLGMCCPFADQHSTACYGFSIIGRYAVLQFLRLYVAPAMHALEAVLPHGQCGGTSLSLDMNLSKGHVLKGACADVCARIARSPSASLT